jgi:hypothetical protein
MVIGVPALVVAWGRPKDGGTIVAVLGAALLAFLCAVAASVVGLVALVRASPRSGAILPFVVAAVALAVDAFALFTAFLGAKWH